MPPRTARPRTTAFTPVLRLDPKEIAVLPFLLLLAVLGVLRPAAVAHPDARSGLVAAALLLAVWGAGALRCPVWHETAYEGGCRWTRSARDLIALALCLGLYPQLRWAVPMLHPAHYDAQLAYADRWLFAGHDPVPMLAPLVHPALTAVLGLAYSCAWLPPLALGLHLFLRRRERALSDLLLGLILVHCAGFLCYFLLPAAGPRFGLAGHFATPLNTWWTARYMAHNINVDAFPSLHIAGTTVAACFLWRDTRPSFWLHSPLLLAIGASTLYLRWHYAVDVLAGLLLAAAGCYVAPRLNGAWERARSRQDANTKRRRSDETVSQRLSSGFD
ncbi:phosphatase PAP2 family protein [Streptomyces sp. ODS28]|uniref:phosphatase PAP2 family protein n=1 Tax=Streptomyces sp. ODS28 TaxID=3136688 RepID=UPI0031F143EA